MSVQSWHPFPAAIRQQATSSAKFLESMSGPRHAICMVCDFFYPRLGGVEMHIWSVSQFLLKQGHKVIVVTGNYAAPGGSRRTGVRYMTNGLKVYYLPLVPCFDQVVFPSYYAGLVLFREILIREGITIVHGHATTSVLAHECLIQARALGRRAVFTDHSLFNFHDPVHINLNKYLSFGLADVHHAIGVSHTCRENLIRRCKMDPRDVSAIPNAVDTKRFVPGDRCRRPGPEDPIIVVILSRLVYRKGIDLAAEVIPRACAANPRLAFVIGGDGPKRLLLEEMRERHGLHARVTLLGAVPHAQVPALLRRGHIFLNTSLTESFCIAILEAACTGCFVVTTRVGGVPEVLPPHMVCMARTDAADLTRALLEAIPLMQASDPSSMHEAIARTYSWADVARRTAKVYDNIQVQPDRSMLERLQRLFGLGPVFGPIAAILTTLIQLMVYMLDVVRPRKSIEKACDVSRVSGGEAWDLLCTQTELEEAIGLAAEEGDGVPGSSEEMCLSRMYDRTSPSSSSTTKKVT